LTEWADRPFGPAFEFQLVRRGVLPEALKRKKKSHMTTLIHEKLTALASEFRLSTGNHASPEEGLCAMELVALLDGQPHSDHPRCTCEIISGFVRGINDNMPDDIRQGLLPYLPRLVDTVSGEHEQERHEFFALQAVRVFAPAALRARGYRRFATVLEKADCLVSACLTAETISKALGKKEVAYPPTPVQLAVNHARRAAGGALWFSKMREDFFKGATSMTPFTACADAAASAAFQAFDAGCTDVWPLAFEALEGALEIGASGLEEVRLPARLGAGSRPDRAGACRSDVARNGGARIAGCGAYALGPILDVNRVPSPIAASLASR
jgi:hypothetical protein